MNCWDGLATIAWDNSYTPAFTPTQTILAFDGSVVKQYKQVEIEPGSVWCDSCKRWWGPNSFHAQSKDKHVYQ